MGTSPSKLSIAAVAGHTIHFSSCIDVGLSTFVLASSVTDLVG